MSSSQLIKSKIFYLYLKVHTSVTTTSAYLCMGYSVISSSHSQQRVTAAELCAAAPAAAAAATLDLPEPRSLGGR